MRPQPLLTSGMRRPSVSREHVRAFGAQPRADAEHLRPYPSLRSCRKMTRKRLDR